MIIDCCLLRKVNLPLVPCDANKCEWYIHNDDYNNCFWVLANALSQVPRGLSIEEIASYEHLSVEETDVILQEAIRKYRSRVRKVNRDLE